MLLLVLAGCNRSASHYTSLGDKFYSKGKYEDAEINYRKAVQKDGSYGPAWAGLGLCAVGRQKVDEAYQDLSRAIVLLPRRDDIKVALANIILFGFATVAPNAGLYNQLVQLSNQLTPNSPYDAYRIKAYLAVFDRRLTEASELFAKANALKPMQPELIFRWAQVLFQNGEFDKGEKLALGLIQKDKSYGRIYDLLFAAYSDAHRPDQAERLLQTRVANNSKDPTSKLLLASYYYARPDRRQQVAPTLQPLLDDPKDFPRGFALVGDFYAERREWEQAVRNYEAGAENHPKERTYYLKKVGLTYALIGKDQQAMGIFQEVLKETPNDDEARTGRARLLLKTGTPENLALAFSEFQGLAKRHPGDPTLLFDMGRILLAREDLEGARKQFQQAVELRKNYVPPLLALAELAQKSGDYKQTLRYANTALVIAPRDISAKLWRAIGLRGTGQDAQARSELESLLRENPGYSEARLQLGFLELAQKRYQRAEERFRTLYMEQPGDPRALFGLADTYVAQNQSEKAFQLVSAESAKPSASEAVHTFLAELALRLSKPDVAIEQYKQLLATHSKSAYLYSNLAMAFVEKGDLPDAIANFKIATTLSPRRVDSMALLARTLNQSGRTAEAIQFYRAALQITPQNTLLQNDLAFLLAEGGSDLDEALKLADSAVRQAPREPAFVDTMGWVYLKKGQVDSALQIFRNAVRENPNNAEYRYHLGVALWRAGDKAKATSEFQTALALGPLPKIREEIQGLLRSSPTPHKLPEAP